VRFTELSVHGAFRVDLERRGDARGFFARMFCAEEFAQHGLATGWVHVNTSYSRETGTLRGLHFQRPPRAEAKLVRCIRGAIFDVVVDLRAGSPTFGHHAAIELDDDNRSMLYVPQGCAHGFQTLAPDTELLYLHSEVHSPEHEGGVHHADPAIGIAWPLPATVISDRDRGLGGLDTLEPIRP